MCQTDFEEYRNYLWMIAQASLGNVLRQKLDASDLVQMTLVRALQTHARPNSVDITVISGWLRQILQSVLIDELRRFSRGKRDAARERSLADSVDASAVGLEHWLAADQTSPSMAAAKNERLLRLSDALLQLPVDQRDVVIMKHLKNLTLQEIADGAGKTLPAVAGLLRRGLAQLRELMGED